jgi:proteasome lid subunit RPN8/RPN11
MDNVALNVKQSKGKKNCFECCNENLGQYNGKTDTYFYCVNDAKSVYEVTYFSQNPAIFEMKNVTTNFMDTVDLLIEY